MARLCVGIGMPVSPGEDPDGALQRAARRRPIITSRRRPPNMRRPMSRLDNGTDSEKIGRG